VEDEFSSTVLHAPPDSLDRAAVLARTGDGSVAFPSVRSLLAVRSLGLGKRSSAPSLPPPVDLVPKVRGVFRFINTSASTITVTSDTILGSLGNIATVANTTVKGWASCFKLHRVTVWPAAGGTASLSWIGSAQSDGRERDVIRDRSIPTGITDTGAVSFSPPSDSLAKLWFDAGLGLQVFLISCTVGSVVDVHIDYCLSGAIASGTHSVSTAVLGNIYYLALDGPSGNVYVPVGLPTTH
jgi:hypothetical protein